MKIEKSFCFFIFFLLSNVVFAQGDPVLMVINGNSIRRSEFEYIYDKEYSGIDKPSLKDCFEMFVDYKLKVTDAESMGMDTTALFKNELACYRQQLAEEYLTDTIVENKVIKVEYDSLKAIGVIPMGQSFNSMKQGLIHYYAVRHDDITPGIETMVIKARENNSLLIGKSDKEVILYENDQLEKQYPDFKHLMQEYYDGILLFDVSSVKIWNTAVEDTVGLAWYFHKNRKKYKWCVPQVAGKKKKKYPDSYKEVKDLVVTDYQNYLDKRWIDKLKKTYMVEINEQVLKTVNDHKNN